MKLTIFNTAFMKTGRKKWKTTQKQFMGRSQRLSQTTPNIPPSGLQGRKSPLKYTFYSPDGQATGTQPHCPSAYRRAIGKSASQGDLGDSATLVVAETAAPCQPSRSRSWASPTVTLSNTPYPPVP